MRKKMKKLVLVVIMLAVLVVGLAPQAAFAQPGGAPEEEIEPATKDAKEALDGTDEAKRTEMFPQIVGGDDVEDGTYSFVAALLWKSSSTFMNCGGSLIDEDSVLTAAHCVNGGGDGKGSPVSASDIQVAVGRTQLSDSDQGELRDVSKIDIHPSYKPLDGRKYDFAVLTLDKPVTEHQPIRLSHWGENKYEESGTLLTVAGWGNTIGRPAGTKPGSNGHNTPDQMQAVQVPVVSDEDAAKIHAQFGDEQWYKDRAGHLVAAGGNEGEGICQGDSGGPLFASEGSSYRLVGVASGGNGCGADGIPMLFAEVNSQDEWIYKAAGEPQKSKRCLPQPYEYRDENDNCVKGLKPNDSIDPEKLKPKPWPY